MPRNDSEAVAWYLRAAAQTDFGGQLGLGRMYAAGRGVPKGEKEALRWFDQSDLAAEPYFSGPRFPARNRSALRITARLPTMFAPIPTISGHCRIRIP